MDVQYWWLRSLKEEGQLIVECIDTESNTADLFTDNLGETPLKSMDKHLFEMMGGNSGEGATTNEERHGLS